MSASAHSYFYQNICKNLLVSLGGIFERTENVWVGTTFDAVDEVADFAEEGVVVREGVYNTGQSDSRRGDQGIRTYVALPCHLQAFASRG